MTKSQTEVQRKVLFAMSLAQFDHERRIRWQIWGAKHKACPTCQQGPYQPCMNMTERKKKRQVKTRWPHETRVDWERIAQGMKLRGYM